MCYVKHFKWKAIYNNKHPKPIIYLVTNPMSRWCGSTHEFNSIAAGSVILI